MTMARMLMNLMGTADSLVILVPAAFLTKPRPKSNARDRRSVVRSLDNVTVARLKSRFYG